MQLWKVEEKSGSVIIRTCVLYAKDSEDAKEKYCQNYHKYANTVLEATAV